MKSVAKNEPVLIAVAKVIKKKKKNEEYRDNSTSVDSSSVCDISREKSARVNAVKERAECGRDGRNFTADSGWGKVICKGDNNTKSLKSNNIYDGANNRINNGVNIMGSSTN